jgi:hypothetical protein
MCSIFSALTLVLYVTAQHMVTLDCVGGANAEGACTAERVELTVWGRHWTLNPVVRSLLLTETRNRVNQCYATRTMVDIRPNGQCH